MSKHIFRDSKPTPRWIVGLLKFICIFLMGYLTAYVQYHQNADTVTTQSTSASVTPIEHADLSGQGDVAPN